MLLVIFDIMRYTWFVKHKTQILSFIISASDVTGLGNAWL